METATEVQSMNPLITYVLWTQPATPKSFNAYHGKTIWKQSVAQLGFWAPLLSKHNCHP